VGHNKGGAKGKFSAIRAYVKNWDIVSKNVQ
jgi:hypothetical protein